MSQENVEVVRAVLDAQRQRDWVLYDPDIEWEDVSGLWGDWGRRRGFEDVQDAFMTWFEAFEHADFVLDDIVDAGDDVVAFIRIRRTGSREWPCRGPADSHRVDGAGSQGRAGEGLSGRGGGPRSRRAFGLGDVAGERRVRIVLTIDPRSRGSRLRPVRAAGMELLARCSRGWSERPPARA